MHLIQFLILPVHMQLITKSKHGLLASSQIIQPCRSGGPLTPAKFQLYLDLISAQEQPGRASPAIWNVDQHIQVSGQRNMGAVINGKLLSTLLCFSFIYGISNSRKRKKKKRSWYGILSLFAQNRNSYFTANGKFLNYRPSPLLPSPLWQHCKEGFCNCVVLNQNHL